MFLNANVVCSLIMAGALQAPGVLAQQSDDTAPPTTATPVPTTDEVRTSIERGMTFLLKDQNTDGSWGGARGAVYTFTGDVWSNPETHRSWKVATTGLCCLALMDVGRTEAAHAAVDRGVDYLLKNVLVKQPNEWDTMNSWAYIYGVQALAAAYGHPQFAQSARREEIRSVTEKALGLLGRFQSLSGGWGYLEFDAPRTSRPQWATSFTTAAGVVAMHDARANGFNVDAGTFERAVRAVKRCLLPSGAYTYSVQPIADPRHSEWIDQIKGSLGRTQCCNLALLMGGETIPAPRLKEGLQNLFRYHQFLDIARNRPIPHETYYLNSGYFYYFGHYYAARLIDQLPPADREPFWPLLQHEIIKTQQSDGSMWDYDMHAYHKPYGVAFGIMTLNRSLAEPKEGRE